MLTQVVATQFMTHSAIVGSNLARELLFVAVPMG
jgi:hypothetical protein